MSDNDQCRAAKLIASQPVCAISGKGGCGKTYVVTKVLTAARANRFVYCNVLFLDPILHDLDKSC